MLGLSGCGSTDADAAPVERKSFALEGRELTIEAGNSSLRIEPADVERVEVERQVDGWVMFGSGPDPVWRMDGGTLTLKVDCDAMISDCEARYTVKVPDGVAVNVDGDNGKITATGFDTPLELSSDNGGVVVRDVSGPLKLRSQNGSVDAKNISGASVEARSDNGEVRLEFAAVPDLVDVVSQNGRIDIDLPSGRDAYAVDADADNGDVDVDVPRDSTSHHVVKVRSDNGGITVRNAG
ncbi:DUF4097 family beta strand repeat-containing protein [uncultured Streptomyces sp.]|uniref:DUF4097 family beta strand repeat-containing protein n=1 Tax=uncultured Streptomyces sp. TaxID=174707 RepID=UPI0026035AEB|nr:DUF4097 family beta strand repeat-containing protein [uncultured Streptomyces sp.]